MSSEADLVARALDRFSEILTPDPDQSRYTFQPGQRVKIVRSSDEANVYWLGYHARVRHSYFTDDTEVAVLDVVEPRPDGGYASWFLWGVDKLELVEEST